MRLAIIGPQNTGKTTFVGDLLKAFPHYTTPKHTYRDVVRKRKLAINQKTGEESQREIRDFIFNQIKSFQGENVVFDRSLLDNYVYSLAQHAKGKIGKRFIEETRKMVYVSLTHVDRLIFIPTAAGVDLINDELRETDRLYIDYINKLFLEEILELARTSPIPIWIISGDRETRIETLRKKLDQQSRTSVKASPVKAKAKRK